MRPTHPPRDPHRFLLAWALTLALPTATSAQQVTYEVMFPNAAHHEASIAVTYAGVSAATLELRMSRTSPGRYALHEFARNVYDVRASDGAGRPLAVTRPDEHTWAVAGHDGTVRVRYTLFADRADGTYSGIDNTQAHLNMPAAFMWARGTEAWPIRIRFAPPPGAAWRIATQLIRTAEPWTFSAPDLSYFLDSPTRLASMSLREWTVRSRGRDQSIRIAMSHAGTEAELDEYTAAARRIVDEQHGVWGELPSFDHGEYTFIAAYLPHVFGDGMEHRNSTILTSSAPLATGRLGQLGTLAHEFFHAWLVERLRPRSLEPFDFEEANMSGDLWFAEGFTSYYQVLTLRRATVVDDAGLARMLTGHLNTVINARGRRHFSPIEMSMQAPFVDAASWIDPQNRMNTFVSYYTWGAAIGLALDLTLRGRSPDSTLDDYMRALWRSHGREETPFTHDDLRRTLALLTGDAAFASDFFARYIEGRDVVDYASLLAQAGFLLRPANPGRASLGPTPLQVVDGALVAPDGSLADSPLHDAGVGRGDRIVAVDGAAVGGRADLERIAAARRPRQTGSITYVKRGETLTRPFTWAEDEALEVVTFEQAGRALSAAQRRFRDRWLASVRGS